MFEMINGYKVECTRCRKQFKPSLFLRKKYKLKGNILCESCIQKQNDINDLLFEHKKKFSLHPFQPQPLKLNQLLQMKNK